MATTKKLSAKVIAAQKRVDKAIDRYMHRLLPLHVLPKIFLAPDDDLSPLPDWIPHMRPALDWWHALESLSGNETYWGPITKITEHASRWGDSHWFWKKRGKKFFIDRDAVNDLRKLEAAIDKAMAELDAANRELAQKKNR